MAGKDPKPSGDPGPDPKPSPPASARSAADPAVADEPKAEVLVKQAIAFGGMRIGPRTEPKGGKVLGPQRAIVPKWLVAAHGPDRVEFVKGAPADAKVGPIDD